MTCLLSFLGFDWLRGGRSSVGIAIVVGASTWGCSCGERGAGADAAEGANGSAGQAGADGEGGGGTGQSTRTFVHPGLLHTQADFDRMRTKIAAGADPWASTWETLRNYEDTSLDQVPQPVEVLVRGGEGENYLILIDDLRAMYGLALAWKMTGDDQYADLAVEFLDAWSSTMTGVSGTTDRYLASGLYAYQLANVGEILRDYSDWKGLERYQSMLLELFYPLQSEWLTQHDGSCASHFWANWDMVNLAGMLAIGVFTDRADVYEEALDYLESGVGNGALENMVYYLHPGGMGQYQESGRDQGHSNLGVTLMGVIAKQAWNQGDDLFAWENHRLLAAFEYIARYNVFEEVPFVPYGPNCADVYQDVVSEAGRGHKRRSWLLPLNHYRNRLGIAVPWMEAKHADVGEEVWRWSNDELGWGSLTETLDPIERGGAPRGIRGRLRGDSIELSFWGSVGAESYTIQRATSADGEFTTVATVSSGEDLTFTDAALDPDAVHHYRVQAIFPDNEASPWSEEVRVAAGPRLLLHLPFDEDEGETAKNQVDASDGAYLHGGATFGPGKNGGALVLDGESAYATIDLELLRHLSDFTIAAWVLPEEARTFARLFDFGANDHRYLAYAPFAGEDMSKFMMTKISHFAEEELVAPALPVGVWTHLAVTLSNHLAVLYVDGVEVARNEEIVFAPNQLGLTGTRAGFLGRSQYADDPLLRGSLDEVRIYSGALSSDDVATLAQQ